VVKVLPLVGFQFWEEQSGVLFRNPEPVSQPPCPSLLQQGRPGYASVAWVSYAALGVMAVGFYACVEEYLLPSPF